MTHAKQKTPRSRRRFCIRMANRIIATERRLNSRLGNTQSRAQEARNIRDKLRAAKIKNFATVVSA